jgi:hypothetical protein
MRNLILILSGLSLCGCAVWNPYIGSNTSDDTVGVCGAKETSDAVRYACSKRKDIEEGRSELVSVQSGVDTLLFPLVGLVGYKASRHSGQAAIAALGAGGIAVYGLSQTLIQPARYGLYDKAAKMLGCAIGIYRTTYAKSTTPLLQRGYYESAKSALLQAIAALEANSTLKAQYAASLSGVRVVIAGVDHFVADASQARLLDES